MQCDMSHISEPLYLVCPQFLNEALYVGHSMSCQHGKETFPAKPPQNSMLLCETVVPLETNVPAKLQ